MHNPESRRKVLVIPHTSQGDVRCVCWTIARAILRCAQDDSQGFVILSAAKDLLHTYGESPVKYD